MPARHYPPPIDRFWAKVRIEGNCWVWTGSTRGRYAAFKVDGRTVSVHVWAWERVNGPVPRGLELDHAACQNPLCVRPSHLEPVSHRENVRRGRAGAACAARQRAKTQCPRGHSYDQANTYVSPSGSRECRTCRRERPCRAL